MTISVLFNCPLLSLWETIAHRKEHFPNTHLPLRPILSRTPKKKTSASSKEPSEKIPEVSETTQIKVKSSHAKKLSFEAEDAEAMMEKIPLLDQP